MAEAQFWLREGTIVGGRYRLEKPLGVGGYGITYRGTDIRLGCLVAVKEYYPGFCANRFAERTNEVRCTEGHENTFFAGRDRFLQEAKTLVQVANIPAIVRVSDFFEENGTAYLVMEYLKGTDLKQMTSSSGGRIPPEVLIPLLEPIVKALGQVHERGLIHRDISPDNIMVLEDGSVRLIDFGNARDISDDKTLTMAMKQGFAPPEQYQSKGQGSWTDVFSLCATMYYCMTGKLPPLPMDRLTGIPLRKISEFGVAISSVQERAILDGMVLQVPQRIQNMKALWVRLYSPPPPPPAPPSPPRPIQRDDRPVSEKHLAKKSNSFADELRKLFSEAIDRIWNFFAQVFKN